MSKEGEQQTAADGKLIDLCVRKKIKNPHNGGIINISFSEKMEQRWRSNRAQKWEIDLMRW